MNTSDVIQYPDTLVSIWKHLRGEENFPGGEKSCGEKWEALEKMLAKSFVGSQMPGIKNRDEALDASREFLANFFNAASPQHITEKNILIRRARKYLAQTRNPVQYEMNKILGEALRTLEKQGEILRDEASQGHNISRETRFVLSEKKDAPNVDLNEYEKHQAAVHFYSVKIRGGDAARTRMLSPADARNLVLELLNAFGGWTRKGDLLFAMKNHIPEQLQFVEMVINGNDEDSVDIVDLHIDPASDVYIYQNDLRQIGMISSETTEKIWIRICEVSEEIFCLYYLPKEIFFEQNKHVSMQNLGKTSTVFNRVEKIKKIIAETLEDYKEIVSQKGRNGYNAKIIIEKIFEKLQGRCTENGYIPTLSITETMDGGDVK